MTADEVRERVAAIGAAVSDYPPAAHAAEDALHRDVLSAIADGCPDAPDLARAALATAALTFERWYE